VPVYEYACKSCGEHIEVSQSFKDEPLTTCAVCGGPLRKVFNSIGIVLKGSGFYRTDSRTPTPRPKEGASKDGGSKDGKDGKGDSGEGSKRETASSAKSDRSEGGAKESASAGDAKTKSA
jgi:putative FmdB family regulatory protein